VWCVGEHLLDGNLSDSEFNTDNELDDLDLLDDFVNDDSDE
jgi:hypothetical protein